MEPMSTTASPSPTLNDAALAPLDDAAIAPLPRYLVLYDGECGLCSKSVRWLIAHDTERVLRYAPLQGDTTAQLKARFPRIPDTVDTVVFVDGDRVHLRSKAFLYLARFLPRPYRWAWYFRWFPAVVLDLAYRLVARLRYRIWGKSDVCSLLPPEQRKLFLP